MAALVDSPVDIVFQLKAAGLLVVVKYVCCISALVNEFTCTGLDLLAMDLSPNCPLALPPQTYNKLFVLIAEVELCPALTIFQLVPT
jgi:hypothetical protein